MTHETINLITDHLLRIVAQLGTGIYRGMEQTFSPVALNEILTWI